MSGLKLKKILFIGTDLPTKNLVDAFYAIGGVLNFNQQCDGAERLPKKVTLSDFNVLVFLSSKD